MRVNSILDLVGDTPHVRLQRLFPDHEVWMKLERQNPGGSIKDRIAVAMIDDAERRGVLRAGMVIVEPTSGNTGIGLAMVAAVKGYRLILVMPESMSVERRRIMAAYGAELALTPREIGMKGAIAKAQELVEAHGGAAGAWMPHQFENPANIDVHVRTTVEEIRRDFPDGLDAIITGVGTGGHITACAEQLKQDWPALRVLAVEPAKSPLIGGGTHTPHRIQGIGAGFLPANLHVAAIDGAVQVTEEDAFTMAQRSAREEGIFVGISSGASLAAVAQTLPSLPASARVLTFCYDTGERYLSVEGLFAAAG